MKAFAKTPRVGDTFTDGERKFTVSRVHADGSLESMLSALYEQAEKERKAAEKAAPAGGDAHAQLLADVERLSGELADARGEIEHLTAKLAESGHVALEVQRELEETRKALADRDAAVKRLEKELAATKKKAEPA